MKLFMYQLNILLYTFSSHKLLEHAIKVTERVFERMIREKVKIDAMQFGFIPGKGTTDAIFTVWQMQEKCGCKGKKLYFAFVDLEKYIPFSTTFLGFSVPRPFPGLCRPTNFKF